MKTAPDIRGGLERGLAEGRSETTEGPGLSLSGIGDHIGHGEELMDRAIPDATFH